MTLLDAKRGTVTEVCGLPGDHALIERLHGFGFYPGKRVRVIKAAPFRGPLLIEDVESGARVMIAREMAATIEVRDDATAVG